jgi:hypothetical protein
MPGQDQCQLCASGSYQVASSATTCVPCEVGTYQRSQGATYCPVCPIGTYVTHGGQAACVPCELGKYGNATGATDCYTCPMGQYQPHEAATDCLLCEPGTFAFTGQDLCSPCWADSYTDVHGATTCSQCDQRNSFANHERTACVCKSGYLLWAPNECIECFAGADCTEDGTTWENLGALPGSYACVLSERDEEMSSWTGGRGTRARVLSWFHVLSRHWHCVVRLLARYQHVDEFLSLHVPRVLPWWSARLRFDRYEGRWRLALCAKPCRHHVLSLYVRLPLTPLLCVAFVWWIC